MAYIEELLSQQQYARPAGFDLGLPKGAAYSSYFPAWEVSTPQYIQPAVYATEQSAFRVNEFVYSIIIKRAKAEAKGHLRVNRGTVEEPEEIKDHALRMLIKHANHNMTENKFWGIKRVSQDLAGFAAFEIEYNVLGEPLRLWFMRPDWCSFRRAQQDPLAYIRYQPYGLAPMDIPLVEEVGGQKRQKILFFSDVEDFDPLFPDVRFFSPAMHSLPQIKVDNAMTFFLADFVEHGAKFAGVLSVAQSIDDTIAEDYRRRWRQQHGGTGNWSEPLILGLNTTFSSMQMNFKDMAFPELDGRTESRICDAFEIDPIVADARVGLNVSTYNNKKEALKDWYQGWVTDTMETNAEVLTNEMLPVYEGPGTKLFCDFDVSHVYVLQEDRTARWTRAVNAWEKRLVQRNVALGEAGVKLLEKGDPQGEAYYEAVTLRPQENVNALGEAIGTDSGGPPQLGAGPNGKKPGLPAPKDAQQEAQAAEEKKFRAFAKRRVKEGKSADIPEYEFRFIPVDRQAQLIAEFMQPDPILALADAINKAVEKV